MEKERRFQVGYEVSFFEMRNSWATGGIDREKYFYDRVDKQLLYEIDAIVLKFLCAKYACSPYDIEVTRHPNGSFIFSVPQLKGAVIVDALERHDYQAKQLASFRRVARFPGKVAKVIYKFKADILPSATPPQYPPPGW